MKKFGLLSGILVSLAMLWLPATAMGQSMADLQRAIDNAGKQTLTRASGDVNDLDLSDFSGLKLDGTLYVRDKQRIRFVNGTLSTADNYKGPIVTVQSGGYLELPSGVALNGNETNIFDNGLVNMTGGELLVSGAELKVATSPISSNGLIKTNTPNSTSSKRNIVNITNGIFWGSLMVNHPGDYINVQGGSLYTLFTNYPDVDIYVSGKVSTLNIIGFRSYTQGQNAHLKITSALTHDIKIREPMGGVSIDNILAVGEGSDPSYMYQLTPSDISHIKYSPNDNSTDWTVYLEDNCAKVKKKTSFTAYDLQAQLDAIAARGTATESSPETITIPEEGVLIDKYITVRSKCHAILTGGPIIMGQELNYDYHFGIESNASLKLKNISIDCNNANYTGYYFFLWGGKLNVNNDVAFLNNSLQHRTGLCYLSQGSELEYWPRESVFKSSGIVVYGSGSNTIKMYGSIESLDCAIQAPASDVQIFWGTVTGGGDVVVEANNIGVTETGTTIKSSRADASSCRLIRANTASLITGTYIGEGSSIEILKSATIGGYEGLPNVMPKLHLAADAYITIEGTLQQDILTIEGDWQDFTIGKSIVYCTKEDSKKIEFYGTIPADRKVYYHKADNSLKFVNLQWIIDNSPLDNTDEDDDPVDVAVPCDGLNVTKDISLAGLQALIDGKAEDECSESEDSKFVIVPNVPIICCRPQPVFPKIKLWTLNGNTTIAKGSCINISNICLDGGTSGTKRIYVEGTLIIDVYVYFRNFKDYVIHVRPGGHVIWRGGWSEGIDKVIYNEGGTVTIEGGYIDCGSGDAIVNIDGTVIIRNDGDTPSVIRGNIVNGDERHTSGTITITEGYYYGGITNYGTLYFNDGEISGGTNYGITNYGTLHVQGGTITGRDDISIWTYTNIYLCGCAFVGDIYLAKGAKVYVTESLTVKIRIHFIVSGGFELNTPIIIGTDGYVLTDDDISLIEVVLPDGYTWEYDRTLHAIIIKSTTGIYEITSPDSSQDNDIYNLNGVKVGTTADKDALPEGTYIVNGKTVVLKH